MAFDADVHRVGATILLLCWWCGCVLTAWLLVLMFECDVALQHRCDPPSRSLIVGPV